MPEQRARSFPPVSIDDLITHDQILEQYPFLSAQILNRWLRQGSVRRFRGKDGKTVYAKADLSCALDMEMTRELEAGHFDIPDRETSAARKGKENNIATNAGAPQPAGTQTEKPSTTADIRFVDRLLNLREVRSMTNLSSPTIYRRMKAGEFPQSRKLSPQCVRWMESEIEKWIAGLPT